MLWVERGDDMLIKLDLIFSNNLNVIKKPKIQIERFGNIY